jgi:hypothetical protein
MASSDAAPLALDRGASSRSVPRDFAAVPVRDREPRSSSMGPDGGVRRHRARERASRPRRRRRRSCDKRLRELGSHPQFVVAPPRGAVAPDGARFRDGAASDRWRRRDLDVWHSASHDNWSTLGVAGVRENDFILLAVGSAYRDPVGGDGIPARRCRSSTGGERAQEYLRSGSRRVPTPGEGHPARDATVDDIRWSSSRVPSAPASRLSICRDLRTSCVRCTAS